MSQDSLVVEEWSNSKAYLMQISEVENKYLLASEQDDIPNMLRQVRNLYSLLKRMVKSSKTRDNNIFDKKHDDCLLKKIREADRLYRRSLMSSRGSQVIKRRRRQDYLSSVEMIRECFESLGDFQISNNLTFKEGIDPTDAWAQG